MMITLKEFILELQRQLDDDKLNTYGEIQLELNCVLIGTIVYIVEHGTEIENPIKIKFSIL